MVIGVFMKILIACYSRAGNTLKVAESLRAKIGADFTRIEPVKSTKGVIGWLKEGYAASKQNKMPIKPCVTDLSPYDMIVFCCPVYSGTVPGAINEYLSEVKGYQGKQYAVVITSGGDRSQKASLKIKEFMDKEGGQFKDMLRVTQKDLNTGEYENKVKAFADTLVK